MDKQSGLPIPGQNTNSSPNDEQLKRAMEADDAERRADKQQAASSQMTRRNKIIGSSLLAAVLLGGAGYGLYQVNPFGSDKQGVGNNKGNGADSNVNSNSKGSQNSNQAETGGDINFWQSNGKTSYPSPLDSWQQKPYDKSSAEDKTLMMNKYAGTQLASASRRLPSADAGFTSDLSKARLADGSLNPMYSTITAQDYQKDVESDVERFINPIYGNWQQYEYADGDASKDLKVSRFSDMFTDDYFQNNKGKAYKDYIPIYADWDSNDYGMKSSLLSNGPRWIGKVKSMNSNFTYDSKKQQYNSDVTVNIDYTAWANNQSVLHKTGVLKMKIVTNTYKNNKPKLLISDASLNVS